MKNIFVGNLDFAATESAIRSLFEAHGAVERVNLVTDRDTGRPRGFAFVEMTDSAAADKAIAADPTKADAYYIKGQALIQKATVDPKTNKITAPPECIAAYQKYLALAPTGPHADEIKGILQGIGESVTTTYKAPKK